MGFGLEPLKMEGAPMHPDHMPGLKNEDDIIRQARVYFAYMRRMAIPEETLKNQPYYEALDK